MRGRYLGRSRRNKTWPVIATAVVLLAAGFYLGFQTGRAFAMPVAGGAAWLVLALWAAAGFVAGALCGAAGCALWLFIRRFRRTARPARPPETSGMDASTLAGLFQAWRRRD